MTKRTSNDPHILAAVNSGALRADPSTGHVSLGGVVRGTPDCGGYIRLTIPRADHGWVTVLAHRVVWIAHRGAIPADLSVNHRNGHPWDNRLANLELVTIGGNNRHARRLPYAAVGGPDSNSVDPEWWERVQDLMRQPNPSRQEVLALLPQTEDQYQPYVTAGYLATRTHRAT